ncbi:ABC-F family ATP-binding cassette domain-containing protein [Phaeodactylibacter luteus]|uniref:Probable ATP-binding protein YbiT n=1 Tax=Phaeodactylibacter luteus TaxID=1564516 RepID=A0A5C6S8T8_9BACT|nr:ABC-F family ATP-binding cassette domain-containing protein [Phaeodactylibacter luteus]TXB70122.1 ABC-F family ATP-binding cassette domain-containing protein [Phaeodactylibacter luteus]
MINANNIFVKYGDRTLLGNINLIIPDRDKVGLVGRNGAGKSTLLKIIAGFMSPHEGSINRPSGSTLGFLHQEMSLPKGKTVMQEALTAFDEVRRMEQRIAEINREFEVRTDYESDSYAKLVEEFSEVNDRFLLLGGQTMEADAERVLTGLGFKPSDMGRLTDEFSGGWQMRIELAKMLLQRPDYLLLDEPTNHLDIESIIWLERFLRDYSGAVIVISHDKQFLDNVTTRTVEVELGRVFDYKAAYSEYVHLREERREQQMAAYENQQRVIADKERTINRFMAKATKTKMAQSMKKQLDKIERIEVDDADTAAMNLRFPPAPRSGQVVLDAKGVSKSYGTLNVLDKVDLKLDRGDRVAFVGQNGQGKTTLAKIIVNELTLSAGDLNLGHNVEIGYYAQNQSDSLHAKLTVLETMENYAPAEMRTRVRSILGAFMFSGEDVEKKVSVLSGGERARLALACLLLRPFNLLVLDEPTNHLDIISKDVLKRAIQEYDGTLIVVSHDREFLAGLTNRTIEFRDRKLHDHLGDVNFFLEKRQLDNMRDVEISKSSGKPANASAKPAKPELSYEDRKRMQRAISSAEKKVMKLEEEIAKMEKEMASSDFYLREDAADFTQQHNAKKEELEEAMEKWEMAQLELMEYED